jgi:putative molybdopterin biosynthesis protein
MERNIYLQNTPLEEAHEKWLTLCREEGVPMSLASEPVKAHAAAGRVTAVPLFAKVSSPPFHSSAMDGIAVAAEKTYGASDTTPVILRAGVDYELLDTGEPLPAGFDAVIMVEELAEVSPGDYEIIKPAAPWQNVRPLGEDIVETELVLPESHVIKPADIGALLNAGLSEIEVRRRPVVAIIPTGTELVEDVADLAPGKILESNSWALAAFAESLGAVAKRYNLVVDTRELILDAVSKALEEADVVVMNAGTSAGREDFTQSVLSELGKVAVHGVAMRPGKPIVLGAARGKPVIGLPGFPVANWRGAEEFLRGLLLSMLGLTQSKPPRIKAKLARKLASAPGFDEFVQVKVGVVDGEPVAVPLPRGSGVSMSLVRSDGVVRVPAASEGCDRWETVDVLLHRDADVEGTILAIGSHDIALDLLATRLRLIDPSLSLASANVGSMGGINAIKGGQAHLAGTHLLDPETGDFNVPYIRRMLPEGSAVLYNLCRREQGLMVLSGNPKGIRTIDDLARDGMVLANRQKGSGTRLLLDHQLKSAGIVAAGIKGYGREFFTHTAVAASVAGGTADTGLGTLAAAKALRLDFLPVASERYDLLVLASFARSPQFATLLKAIRDEDFRRDVEALGGYDLSTAGEKIEVW